MAKHDSQAPIWVVFDGGNSLWKFIFLWLEDGRFKSFELVIPHAIVEDMNGSRFQSVKARFSRQEGIGDTEWLGVDGCYFVVGGSAESEGVVTRRTGSAKYSRDYMGVALCAGLLQALPQGWNHLHLYVSFPPGDVTSVDDLINSVIGKFTVETSGTVTARYHIRSVQPFDEPLGAYINAMTDPNGVPYKDHHLTRGSTLVIDIGGKISNVLRIMEGGRVQYGSAYSVDLGMQDVVQEFGRLIKAEHPVLKRLRHFDEGIVRRAILTGQYEFKGRDLPCAESVRGATTTILNQLNKFYENHAASGANDRNMLVTGGGGGAMFPLLQAAFEHERMFKADRLEEIHLANARGGARLCRAAVLSGQKGRRS